MCKQVRRILLVLPLKLKDSETTWLAKKKLVLISKTSQHIFERLFCHEISLSMTFLRTGRASGFSILQHVLSFSIKRVIGGGEAMFTLGALAHMFDVT